MFCSQANTVSLIHRHRCNWLRWISPRVCLDGREGGSSRFMYSNVRGQWLELWPLTLYSACGWKGGWLPLCHGISSICFHRWRRIPSSSSWRRRQQRRHDDWTTFRKASSINIVYLLPCGWDGMAHRQPRTAACEFLWLCLFLTVNRLKFSLHPHTHTRQARWSKVALNDGGWLILMLSLSLGHKYS